MVYSDYGLTAKIPVKFPPGATLTCSHEKGAASYDITNDTGEYTFKVHTKGVWTISATDGLQTDTKQVTITHDGQITKEVILAFTGIFGIQRRVGSSSSAWERTDMAVGATATPSIGTVAGHSDFDKVFPWRGMVRETLRGQVGDYDDVMVKIPKFYYQRYKENNIEHIRISSLPQSGFSVHPVFTEGGKEHDYIYVGAYSSYDDYIKYPPGSNIGRHISHSLKGYVPEVSRTRDEFRQSTTLKGPGWHLFDIAAWSAIQMLYLVEFADYDAKKVVGSGRSETSSTIIATGSCDNVPNLTGRPAGTDGKVDVVYRGIEGLWGNAGEWLDGINTNNTSFYVCTDPSKYKDNTSSGYTFLSYRGEPDSTTGYPPRELGVDTSRSWAMLCEPWRDDETSSGYYLDYYYSASGWNCCFVSRSTKYERETGLFFHGCHRNSNYTSKYVGSRVMYVPS